MMNPSNDNTASDAPKGPAKGASGDAYTVLDNPTTFAAAKAAAPHLLFALRSHSCGLHSLSLTAKGAPSHALAARHSLVSTAEFAKPHIRFTPDGLFLLRFHPDDLRDAGVPDDTLSALLAKAASDPAAIARDHANFLRRHRIQPLGLPKGKPVPCSGCGLNLTRYVDRYDHHYCRRTAHCKALATRWYARVDRALNDLKAAKGTSGGKTPFSDKKRKTGSGKKAPPKVPVAPPISQEYYPPARPPTAGPPGQAPSAARPPTAPKVASPGPPGKGRFAAFSLDDLSNDPIMSESEEDNLSDIPSDSDACGDQ